MIRLTVLAIALLIANTACEVNNVYSVERYQCNTDLSGIGVNHPKAAIYQDILDRNRKLGIIGASMMIKDADGIWIGASGKADIASGIDVEPCNRFLIASISKSFTAAAVFALIDQEKLALNDPVNKWISKAITKKVENADESTIEHLLNHTSGIPDYLTLQYELDRINVEYNDWSQSDVLEFTFGKKATHNMGETYYYSNTNYLLLGMIIEAATGLSLEQAYTQLVFEPANLVSAYYSVEQPIPSDNVKGYVDIYGNDEYVESEFLYKDELRTADGGIAINVYDLGLFFERLWKGDIVSEQSLATMTDFEPLPDGWVDEDFGHFENGLGIEYNKTPYGNSIGHTGGIDGFLSIAQYFPEHDATFILLVNSGSYVNTPRLNIYNESLEAMFTE